MANQTEDLALKKEEPQREKKRGGFLARFFGGGGSGGSVASVGVGNFGGAAGELGGILGRFAGSGILATKAGLLAVVLAGATVAGGIGVIGYNLLNPAPVQPGDNLQLFASKPKNDTPEVAPVPEDGRSQSLTFLNEANRDPGSPEAPQTGPAAAPQDETAAASAAAASSDGAAGTGPSVAAAGGNGVSTLLKGTQRFGQLTSQDGGGKGAVSGAAAGAGAGGSASALAASSHAGMLSAMRKGLASSNGARSIAGRRFGNHGALGQAFGAMRDNRTATSSAGGGVTYDGSAAAGSNIGANGSTIGGPSGDATGPAQAKSVNNPAAVDPQLAPPPTPDATPMAPWQNAIKTAQMLIGLSVGLMLVAKLLAKTQYGKIAAMVIAAVVASIGAMVIALGAQIANGQYGQKLQGGVLAAAGVGLMIAAAATALGGKAGANNASGLNPDGTGAVAADSSGVASSATGGASDSGSILSSVNPFVLIGGGLSLIGLCGSMMIPPKTYPSKDFQNGHPPDTHFFGSVAPSSRTPFETMV